MKKVISALRFVLPAFLLVGFLFTNSATVLASTTVGPANAATGTNVSGVGSVDWSHPDRITANDGNNATATVSLFGSSKYLQGTNYGFNIPTGATINGIQVYIQRKSSATTAGISVNDDVVKLIKGGSVVGDNKAISTDWLTSATAVSYGGAADLWGTTWTPADINAANFGVALAVQSDSLIGRTASVNYMQIAVNYTADTTPPPAPSIDTSPASHSNSLSFAFTFSDTEAGVIFLCRVDSDPFSVCTSPFSGTTVAGAREFDVKAKDLAGNESAIISYLWNIDTTLPTVSVTTTAANPTNVSPIPFAITFSEDVTGFDLADVAITNGTSATLSTTDAKHYTLDVTPSGDPVNVTVFVDNNVAHDAASNGNTSGTLTVGYDHTAPGVAITSGPTNGSIINSNSATFDFSADAGATLECQFTGSAAFFACSPTQTFAGLVDSSTYTFTVKATDAALNSAQVSRTFTVDLTAPTIASHTDVTTEATSNTGAVVTYTLPTTSDNVDVAGVATCSPLSGTNFTMGTTPVNCNAADVAGNSATQTTFNVIVHDTTIPVITLVGSPVVNITVGGTYTDAGATATDNIDGVITPNILTTFTPGAVDTSVAGIFTAHYNVTDAGGNNAVEVTRTINVNPFVPQGSGTLGGYTPPTPPADNGTLPPPTDTGTTPLLPDTGDTTLPPAGEVLGAQTFKFTKFMRLGSKGNEVTELQKRLTTEGFYTGAIDGKFGKSTEAAVKAYQKANPPLRIDGIVGVKTRAVLNK